MASFALVSVEKDYKVALVEGKVTVGRGPLLQITDKRVSRNHATLEVSAGSLTVLPIHTNPTFYQASGEEKCEPLEKDEVRKLQNGDCISFLPNELKFRVEERNDCGGDNDAKTCNLECNVGDNNINDDDNKVLNKQNNDKEISNDSDELVKERDSETALDEEDYYSDDCSDSNDGQDDKETEIEQKAELLNKTRVLPSWMTKDKGDETKQPLKKGKASKKNTKKVSDDTEVKIEKDSVESAAETRISSEESKNEASNKTCDDRSGIDEGSEEEENNCVGQEKTSITEEENSKRKREVSEDDEDKPSKKEKKLPRCPYGARCYRKNPVHFQEYSHDQPSDESENEDESNLPECPYGEYCYRKNPRHRKEYKHTPQPKTRERRAKKKAGIGKIRDDDEDGPNDYDYEDSFIDDESESECEPSDDSDWQPSCGDDDDDDDDDVKELLTEARNFTQSKKMLKPTSE